MLRAAVGPFLKTLAVGPRMSNQQRQTPGFVSFAIVPLLYFIGAKAAVALTVMPEGMAILWPPNGVLLAALVHFQGRGYLMFAALTLCAEIAADLPSFGLAEALLFGINNVFEATIAYWLLRYWRFSPRFSDLSDLVKFVVAGPFSFWSRADPGREFIVPRLFPDGAVAVGGVMALGLVLAARDGTLLGIHVSPVLLLPFVVYLAARFTISLAAFAVAVVSLVVLVLTTRGHNPFGHVAPRDAVIHAQEFIFTLSLEAKVMDLNDGLQRVRERTQELEIALAQVNRLQGLLPICAWCKKVRDDKHYWHSVEDYISRRTEARFSHGICPDCLEKSMSEYKR